MLAKPVWAGDAASCELKDAVLCELKGHLVRIALCASNLRPCSESSSQRRPQQRLWDVFLSNSSFISHRHCNEALLHFTAHDSDRRVVGIGRCCKATDGFLEGADGEVTASDCVDLGDGIHNREQHSVLWNLVQEIEPLDASRVSEGVSNDSKDAMKRTISGMLGLLPSDQFEVIIRTKQEELEKLLTSSVMTGYTLRNAEYRVCLQRSLGLPEAGCELGTLQGCKKKIGENAEELQDAILMDEDFIQELFDENWSPECDISPGLEQYINQLESKLFAAMEELQSYKQKTDSLDMSTIVRAEKNDLLDYLRSLDAEKVSELSCPSSSEVEEIVRHVVSRCLQVISATSYTVQFECNSARSIREHEDGQATLTINRDHLARLLFWCMLFGHYLRGLDYRLELSHTLRLCEDVNSTGSSG